MRQWFIVLFVTYMFPAISQVTIVKTNETCKGKKDGTIQVIVTGIDGPFKYEWQNISKQPPVVVGSDTDILTGLEPGDYAVTVSLKAGGCMDMKAAKIYPGKEFNVSISGRYITHTPRPIPCGWRPEFTYQLTAIPSGGTPPYYCSWAQGGGTTGECSKNVIGKDIEETVFMIDSNGCVDQETWTKRSMPKICPQDPNDISGPEGYDSLRWVSVSNEMDYTVRFENDPIFATANAANVLITVPIDDDIDPFSFRLENLGFGDKIIEVPDNSAFFQQRIDYSADLGFMLDVTAGLDLPNSRFFWLLETIDPLTGQSPTDPTAGFLPVNDTLTGSGEGYVNFTCKPKSNSQTGAVVSHQASIIFDVNDPLLTNTWSNTIDAFAPTTFSVELPDTLTSNEVSFVWTVSDDPGGCGVQYSRVLLSKTSHSFETAAIGTLEDSVSLVLDWDTKYYYKIAGNDFVLNQEDPQIDSFYIIPKRAIAFITPDRDDFCIGDTLDVSVELISIPTVDLLISIDSGMTYVPLATGINTWPYGLLLDSSFLNVTTFLKARNAADNVELISDPFRVHALPDVQSEEPVIGCANEILFVEATGANAYTWSPASIIAEPYARFSNVYTDSSQYVYVQGTDVYGCTNIDSLYLTVYPVSLDTLPQPLCEGDSVFINGQWETAEGFYTTTYVNGNGCDSVIVSEVYFESPCIWAGGLNVYVDHDATGDNNGTSWADAFNELRDAIYVAGRYENVQEIWVAEGVYNPHPTNRDTSFILRDSIKIYGGFLGFETTLGERTADPELVQLSGDINVQDTLWDNSYHTVIFSQTCSECIIDGVTITYGHADHANNPDNIGAGVLNEGVGHFRNVIFERNYATDQGGALHSSGAAANLIIEDCIFRLNTSSLGKDVVNLAGAQVEFRGANSIH